jgi:hypothetical protein
MQSVGETILILNLVSCHCIPFVLQYDEVIRRDSDNSLSVPLLASPVSQTQGLSSVPEHDEPLNDSRVADQPDAGATNQEDSVIVEENVHADTEPNN